MAILEIRKYPDEVLQRRAESVSDFNGELQTLIDNMIETMYAAPGVGLAAPQVGVSRRLAVIDVSSVEENSPLMVIINPEIMESEGSLSFEEGCLSIPDYLTKVSRSEKVTVRALDRNGNQVEICADGLLAIALQHEIDHLDGILLIDRISPIKREFFKKRIRKALKSDK